MKEVVTEEMFIRTLSRGSSALSNGATPFSYGAREALFAHMVALEESTGIELAFNPIAIMCDWVEFPSAAAAAEEYSECPKEEASALAWLHKRTSVVSFETGILLVAF